MLFEFFETIVRLRLERDKWKDVFVRIFRGRFEICSFRLGIFWPQSAPHSTDTALHTLISIYCGFKHNWALLSHIILVQIAICILFILDFHLWPVCKTYIGPSSRDQNWNNWLKQLNFFRPQQTIYWCCLKRLLRKRSLLWYFLYKLMHCKAMPRKHFPLGDFCRDTSFCCWILNKSIRQFSESFCSIKGQKAATLASWKLPSDEALLTAAIDWWHEFSLEASPYFVILKRKIQSKCILLIWSWRWSEDQFSQILVYFPFTGDCLFAMDRDE